MSGLGQIRRVGNLLPTASSMDNPALAGLGLLTRAGSTVKHKPSVGNKLPTLRLQIGFEPAGECTCI
jgi:hypothetical protein